MLVRLAVCLLIAGALSSCATVPRSNPEAEMKFVEANVTLDSMQEEFKRFYSDVGEVLEKIALLYAQPGWQEMESIIRSSHAEGVPEVQTAPDPGTNEAIEEWGLRWEASGEDLFSDYLALVDRCSFLEVRRLTLKMRIRYVEIMLTHALAMETSPGRTEQQKMIERSIDEVQRQENELDAYTINPIGLYEPAGTLSS